MRNILFAILWILLEANEEFISNENIYCTPRFVRLCRNKGKHVGCQFPESVIGPKCRNYTKIEFDDKLREYVTDYLNRRRNNIAAGLERLRGGQLLPSPEIMMFVTWDSELALLAQRLADQCSLIHDDCRATAKYPFAGQTVGAARWHYRDLKPEDIVSAIHSTVGRILDAWWAEKYKVTPQELVEPFKSDVPWGHFSQLAVWSLKAIGCGAVSHGDRQTFLMVCDFSHTNMLGQKTLELGPLIPCPSNMVRSTTSLYPLLCCPKPIKETNNYKEVSIFTTNKQDYLHIFTYEEDDDNFKELTREFESFIKVQDFTEKNIKLHEDFVIITDKNIVETKIINQPTESNIDEKDFESVNELKIRSQWLIEKDRKEELNLVRTRPTLNFELSTQQYLNQEMQKWQPYYNNDEYHSKETEERQSWVQRRNKPLRPGEKPLFQPNIIGNRQEYVSKMYSVTMDEDIIRQIYNDTGFKKQQ